MRETVPFSCEKEYSNLIDKIVNITMKISHFYSYELNFSFENKNNYVQLKYILRFNVLMHRYEKMNLRQCRLK